MFQAARRCREMGVNYWCEAIKKRVEISVIVYFRRGARESARLYILGTVPSVCLSNYGTIICTDCKKMTACLPAMPAAKRRKIKTGMYTLSSAYTYTRCSCMYDSTYTQGQINMQQERSKWPRFFPSTHRGPTAAEVGRLGR